MINFSKPLNSEKYHKLDEKPIKEERTDIIEKVWSWFDTYGVLLLLLFIFGLHLTYPILCPGHLSLMFTLLLVTYGLGTLAKGFNIIGIKGERKCFLWTSVVFAMLSIVTASVFFALMCIGFEDFELTKDTFAVMITQLYVIGCNLTVISDAWTKLKNSNGRKTCFEEDLPR